MFQKKMAAAIALLLTITWGAFAQSGGGDSANGALSRGESLTIKLAVAGPGDELYLWWGHIGLIIEDGATGQSRFYDWGVFSFDEAHFFRDFAFGRLIYRCVASPSARNLRGFVYMNRDITVYTLDISAEKKEKLREFAENNVKPENCNYAYHMFKDNCATRIRDIVDAATDGQFKQAFSDPGRFTWRQHVRRHTWFNPFFDWLLNFWMGQDIDVGVTKWQEMFLPSEIARNIADFSYIDEKGAARKLVGSVEVLNKAVNRPAVLDAPRAQWPRELVLGLAIAALLFFFSGVRQRKPRLGRALWGLSQSALGLFFGLAGSLLFFMTFFTNHDYAWHNANVIFVNPLLFAAVPLGIVYAVAKRGKTRFFAEQFLKSLWTYVLLGGILTMLIKVSPRFYQQNQVTLALMLPFALVSSFAVGWAMRLLWAVRLLRKKGGK